MAKKMSIAGIVILAFVGLAWADATQFVQRDIHIPKGESRVFELGVLPNRDSTILLDITARLDMDHLCGSNTVMKLSMNGKVANGYKSRLLPRIINKNLISPVTSETRHSWFEYQAWRVPYAPDFESALALSYYEGNPYQTVIDVTDLIDSEANNRLEIYNLCPTKADGSRSNSLELVIKELAVRQISGVSPMLTAGVMDQDMVNNGTSGAGPANYSGSVLPGGGFQLVVSGRQYNFNSRISYPNAGMNHLSASSAPDTGASTISTF